MGRASTDIKQRYDDILRAARNIRLASDIHGNALCKSMRDDLTLLQLRKTLSHASSMGRKCLDEQTPAGSPWQCYNIPIGVGKLGGAAARLACGRGKGCKLAASHRARAGRRGARARHKSNAAEDGAESVKDILHQATVRRDVVLRLIEAAVRRKHPAYRQVSMEQVALKAQELPEHGVPPEVVAILPHDTDLDNLQPQKVATPVPECVTPSQAASELGVWLKPNAVVCEKSSVGSGDVNAQQVATLEATAPKDGKEESKAMGSLTLTTGNRLFDQFKPEYFGLAFPHVFKFCSAMPDPPPWSPNPRHRRARDAPRLELQRWVRAMARRCEAQVGRDWVFGFTSWNLLFRSSLNLSRAPLRYTEPIFDEKTETWRNLTAKDIEAGAIFNCWQHCKEHMWT